MALVTSVLTGGVNNHPTTSEEANAWSTDFISQGIVGALANTSGVAPATGGLACNAQGTPDMTIAVTTGRVYVNGTPTSQNSQTFRIKLTANQDVTISANASGSTKYDWVYVKLDATKLNGPNVAGDDAATLVTSRSTSQSSDDGTPPTYGYCIAVVTVANGASSITNGNIRDSRANAIVNLGSSSVSSGWTDLGYAPNTVTTNGNRSYSLVFNSVDLTSTLSNGMRLKLPRTVTPPTQCTSLNGTTQYYNKTSPAGMTFTDDFVASAWVKLTSYSGSTQPVISRYNGTSGWDFGVSSTGGVYIEGFNAGAANFSQIVSYQSIPLNKWVHIAAQLDMSTFTATATTSYMMIDGVNVPGSISRGGTNPTALIQAGNLEIGSRNGGLTPFPGKIAQAAVYSSKVTQATIAASMNQTLTGSETSLISAYSFNNSINDLSANANNLTAQASAVATNVDSPMNAIEYGIIMGNSFSTNTTLTVQVPEGYSLPTSGGIGLSSYSIVKAPQGFPTQPAKWRINSPIQTTLTTASNASFGAFQFGGWALSVPAGSWFLAWQGQLYNATTTQVWWNLSPTALTGLSVINGALASRFAVASQSPSAANVTIQAHVRQAVELQSLTTYTMYTFGATTSAGLDAGGSTCEIYAENGYL